MPPDPPQSTTTVNVSVELAGPDWHLRTTMTVPKEPITLTEMLPLVYSFADAVVGAAAKTAQQGGKTISCKRGCGACCRQPVPLSEAEARWIYDLVNRLPADRQSEIRKRFAAARRRLAEAGLLEKLHHPEGWQKGEGWSLAMSYFRLGIPCPFLENEACSIHPDRPLKCREYLVTSPAENCRQPTAGNIDMVELPFQMWMALARLEQSSPDEQKIPWVPLILVLEWAESHKESAATRPGHESLKDFFALLSRKQPAQEKSESSETF